MFEAAVHETCHHHARFMAATSEAPGWVSQFRELQINVDARLHDIRDDVPSAAGLLLDPDDYTQAQQFRRRTTGQRVKRHCLSKRARGGGLCGSLLPGCCAQSDARASSGLPLGWRACRSHPRCDDRRRLPDCSLSTNGRPMQMDAQLDVSKNSQGTTLKS